MPYPPPPPPPEVGEFQAIGLLPAPQLPDVTGHAGEFLETDGIIPQWEPVTGGLPDPTGHAGEFLTTDGVTASWAAISGVLPDQSGHTGQFLTTDGASPSWATVAGGGIIAIGAITTPTANAAIISGGNTLQIASADATHPGIIDTTDGQTFGGIKLFPDGAATKVFDVRDFGAVANDVSNDLSVAFYAAVAVAQQTNTIGLTNVPFFASVYIPQGQWYTSKPLVMPPGVEVFGDGMTNTTINPGIGALGDITKVSGFSGPIFYGMQGYTASQLPSINSPTFTTSLATGSGQALVLGNTAHPPALSLALHDSFAWGNWIGNDWNTASGWSVEFFLKITDTPVNGLRSGVIGSRGPDVWGPADVDGGADVAWGVYVTSNGTNLFLKAYLTTNVDFDGILHYQPHGTLHTITSSAITGGATLHVSLNYDGSFFDFYVNGVNQGHVSAQGGIVKAPWEGTFIGGQGPELIENPGGPCATGAIDSIRLSKVARHTGTGSFTPPTTKYAWDSNTYALYNWDQAIPTVAGPGAITITLPFIVGQVATGVAYGSYVNPTLVGPLPHYIRYFGGAVSPNCYYHDFSINCFQSCSGIIIANSWRNRFERILISSASQFGLRIGTAVSFFADLDTIYISGAAGTGLQYFGTARNIDCVGTGIGVHTTGGALLFGNPQQPQFNNYASLVMGTNSSSPFESVTINSFGNDAEVYNYTRQIGIGVVIGVSELYTEGCFWAAQGSSSPPILYFNAPLFAAGMHVSDVFFPGTQGDQGADAPPATIFFYGGSPDGRIQLFNSYIHDFNQPPLPISNAEGWVAQLTSEGMTNLVGLSNSDLAANNLAGQFSILSGFTSGGAFFLTPEPDANYQLNVTPAGNLGVSTPAAGSNRVTFPITKTQNGFTVSIETDPGGDASVIFDWVLIRGQPPPLLFVYQPAVPSTDVNPLVGSAVTAPFSVGATMIPASGNTFVYDSTAVAETIFEAGTTVAGTNWWELSRFGSGAFMQPYFGAASGQFEPCFVSSAGRLCSFLSPGAHNVVLTHDGAHGNVLIDGGSILTGGPSYNAGSQQTPIYVGERYDTSQPLTTATLRNLKVDHILSRCISIDNDVGPGAQTQNAFLGDDWTVGNNDNSGSGGFASQIASSRYGSGGTDHYYWLAALWQGQLADSTNTTGVFGLLDNIWKPWQGQSTAPDMDALVIMCGFWDILKGSVGGTGNTAAATWTRLLEVLEGSVAEDTWFPPTSTTTPRDQHAFAVATGARSAGTTNYVINGTGAASLWNTDSLTTATDFLAVLNGTPAIAAVFDMTVTINTDGAGVLFRVKVPGTAGNGIPFSCDGAAGGFLYGDIGGTGGTGLAVSTLAGLDTTCSIAGIQFIANFDTNVATTVNNLVTAVNTDITTSAVVTASNVANQMRVVANTAGFAGNSIVTGGNALNTPEIRPWLLFNLGHHLFGGANGATQNNITDIFLCNVPPMGTQTLYTAGKETQRLALNASIGAYVHAGVTVVDVAVAVADGGTPANLNPIYDDGGGSLNAAGHTVLFTLFDGFLP